MQNMSSEKTLTHRRYKDNFLKNVIFRLDFSTLTQLEDNNEPIFGNAIAERYSAPTKKTIKELEVSFGQDNSKIVKEESIWRWEYFNKDSNDKIVTLLKNAIIFECRNRQYKDFISFKEDAEFILNNLQKSYSIDEFNRMGLRYINEIIIPENNPLDWQGFINSDLSNAIKAGVANNFQPVRSMHQLQFKDDEITVLFNYGIFNRDYPNPVAKPELILDYDYYISSVLNKNEIVDKLVCLNSISKQMFESSIGDRLREKMEVING